jgi:hypothetical protein
MKCDLSGKEESQPINNSLVCRDCYNDMTNVIIDF